MSGAVGSVFDCWFGCGRGVAVCMYVVVGEWVWVCSTVRMHLGDFCVCVCVCVGEDELCLQRHNPCSLCPCPPDSRSYVAGKTYCVSTHGEWGDGIFTPILHISQIVRIKRGIRQCPKPRI